MMRIRHVDFVWICAWPLFVGACASPGPSPAAYTVRHVSGADRAAVLDTAQTALAELGYAIDQADPDEAVITTQPVRVSTRDEPATTGSRLSSRGAMRRVAQVRVSQTGELVNVYCKVIVQEQTTEAHRMFEGDHMSSDVPGHTPIERDAATTTRQNVVWETVRRDKAAERRILDTILKETGPAP